MVLWKYILFASKRGQSSIPGTTKKSGSHVAEATKRGAGMAIEVTTHISHPECERHGFEYHLGPHFSLAIGCLENNINLYYLQQIIVPLCVDESDATVLF